MPYNMVLGPIDQVFLLGGAPLLIDFAVWLKAQGVKVVIVTAPRHAQEPIYNDGKTLEQSAQAAAIEFHVLNDINDLAESSRVIHFTEKSFALSIGAAWIFKGAAISELFKNRLFNLHGSRLPQYRGGGGFSWQALGGSRLGFCLVHFIDPAVDTGDILTYKEFLYPAHCRIPADYEDYYRQENFHFLQALFERLQKGSVTFQPISQSPYFAAYWPRLHTPTHGWIDWSMPVEMLDRFICAFDDPYPGAQTTREGVLVRLKKTLVDYNDGSFHPFQYGLVYRNNGKWISVAAKGGTLIVQTVLDEKKEDLIGVIKPGDRFFTPHNKIEEALNQRIFYSPQGFRAG